MTFRHTWSPIPCQQSTRRKLPAQHIHRGLDLLRDSLLRPTVAIVMEFTRGAVAVFRIVSVSPAPSSARTDG